MACGRGAEVLDRVNERLDTAYRLVRPLKGGRQGGAWLIRAGQGASAVFTWTINPSLAQRRDETARLVRALVDKGYPTPAWHHAGAIGDGLAFVIADFVPGRPATWPDLPVDKVVDAVEQQADLAGHSANTWNDYARHILGSPDGPRRDIAGMGPRGRQFLERLDEGLPDISALHMPASDAVHGDLESGNILLARGANAIAIVDIDACGPGTRALDYGWLLRDAWSHRAAPRDIDLIREHGEAVAGADVLAACLAAACLELAAFVVRSGNPARALGEIERLTPLLG